MVTKERILKVSASLFAAQGYRATNLERVAQQLNVSRQALYYHFRRKSDILAALFDEVMTRMETSVGEAAKTTEEPRFVAMIRAHVDVIIDNTNLVAVLLHERSEIAKIRKLHAAQRRQDYSDQFIEAFEEGRRAGVLRDLDAHATVNALLAAANGTSSWYHPSRSSRDPQEVAALVADLLLTSVVSQPMPAAKANNSSTRRSAAKV
jgi:AcrR family transcriptional regulator